MNILIEGWRGINHSFSLVNQWQILELSKSCDIFFNDVPFASEKWNKKKNFSGLEKNLLNFINSIPNPQKNQINYVDWIELIKFKETRNYVQRVLENASVYRYMLNGKPVELDNFFR